MSKINIEKDIIVKDQYGVTRQVWLAGDEVEDYVYFAILKQDEVVNPEDLPVPPKYGKTLHSLHASPVENKMLDSVEEKESEQATEIADEIPAKPKKKSAKLKKG